MKKAFFTMGALAMTLTAPTVSADICVPGAAPSAEPAAPAAESVDAVIIKRYICNSAAKALDIMAEAVEQSDGSPLAQAKIALKTMTVVFDMPVDELPAKYQEFARAAYDAAKPVIAKLEGVIEQMESGSINEMEALAKIAEITQEGQAIQQEVEARYPELAKQLGSEATKRMTAELLPVLQMKAVPLLKDFVAEHPEAMADQKLMTATLYRIMADLLRQTAAGR